MSQANFFTDSASSLFLIISHSIAFVSGCYIIRNFFKNEIQVLKIRQKADKWETPKDFRERTGSELSSEAAVYCQWKKNGQMYRKLKILFERNIAPDPDMWTTHAYSTALSLGNAHGEQMEILCANSDLGCPPRVTDGDALCLTQE